MATRRIQFIPWAVSFEIFGEAVSWIKAKKFYNVVHYSKIKNPVLYFTDDGEIYVHGHGDAGDPEISPGKGTLGSDLNYREVADRLIKTGLKKDFHGKIKLYSCMSGVGRSGPNTSFANLFANYMRSQGYNNCTYHGYIGYLSGKRTENGYKDTALIDGVDKKGEDKYVVIGRASEHRVEF